MAIYTDMGWILYFLMPLFVEIRTSNSFPSKCYYVNVAVWISSLIKYVFTGGLCLQGPLAFYKGFIPNFARLGTWNVIMFLTLEQVS